MALAFRKLGLQMKAIDKARRDARIAALLEEISDKIKIKYKKSDDDGWGTNFEAGVTTVYWSGCKHPSASLAHELLHLKTQLSGYRRVRVGTSSLDQTKTFGIFIRCIDNELQHHKFYNEFLSLGFRPDQFYMDSDSETEAYLNQEIDQGINNIFRLVTCFFTAIAPGGAMSAIKANEIKEKLFSVENGNHSAKLKSIEEIVKTWSEDKNYDVSIPIKKIMLEIEPNNNLTWFGYASGDTFPEEGFFVDLPFDIRPPDKS